MAAVVIPAAMLQRWAGPPAVAAVTAASAVVARVHLRLPALAERSQGRSRRWNVWCEVEAAVLQLWLEALQYVHHCSHKYQQLIAFGQQVSGIQSTYLTAWVWSPYSKARAGFGGESSTCCRATKRRLRHMRLRPRKCIEQVVEVKG